MFLLITFLHILYAAAFIPVEVHESYENVANQPVAPRPVERGGKGGKFSRAPRHFGGPASVKSTENGVPGGLFLT